MPFVRPQTTDICGCLTSHGVLGVLHNGWYLREERAHFVLSSSIARDCYRPCMPQQWLQQSRNAGQAHPTALQDQAYRLTKQCACYILGWPPAIVRRLPQGRFPGRQPQLFNYASWRMFTRPAVFNLTVSAVRGRNHHSKPSESTACRGPSSLVSHLCSS